MSNSKDEIIERFSTYICLREQSGRHQLTPIKIRARSHQYLLETLLKNTKKSLSLDGWARHFLKNLIFPLNGYLLNYRLSLPNPVVLHHFIWMLACNDFVFFYLQPVCWEVAVLLDKKISFAGGKKTIFSVEDYFVLACENALDPGSWLRNFDFKAATQLHLFSKIALQRKVKNQVVRELKNKNLKFTGYGLLKYTSSTALREALLNYGIRLQEIQVYQIVCQSFKDYLSNQSSVNIAVGDRSPKKITLDSLAKASILNRTTLHARRMKLDIQMSEQQISRYLETAIKAVQNNQQKKMISLESLTQDPTAGHWSSHLTSDVLVIEDDDLASSAKEIILSAFQSIGSVGQASLILWLGLEINQTDFCLFLKLEKQYQVARQFQRYQRIILRSIIQAYQAKAPNSHPQKPAIEQLCQENLLLVKDYLKTHSRQWLSEQVRQVVLPNLEYLEREYLYQWISDSRIAKANSRNDGGVNTTLPEAFLKMAGLLKDSIQQELGVHLSEFKSADKRIYLFLMEWLIENQALLPVVIS
jgi:hypothetical protein